MGRYTGKSCRLLCMLSLTSSFFLVELIVGYVTNSLALVGDSYHMLSDVVALFVGFASVRIAKWPSKKNTFGWARAEVLGALVNAVFLIALCFTIFVEALQRMFHDEHIHDPDLMLIVGSIGLVINLVGLLLFHGHGHGHSHGGHGHSHSSEMKKLNSCGLNGGLNGVNGELPNREPGTKHEHERDHDTTDDEDEVHPHIEPKLSSSAQLNMRGVFLHVLGDALGSVIVIISALVIKFVEYEWRFKVDPAMSMLMVLIILSTTIPLLKESALILLQTVPTHIQVSTLQYRLIERVEGVLAVHEFHIWQLAGNRIIASAHIRCQNLRDYMRIAEDVKNFFHEEGIHSTTIQPEFVEGPHGDVEECLIRGRCADLCYAKQCCAPRTSTKIVTCEKNPETVVSLPAISTAQEWTENEEKHTTGKCTSEDLISRREVKEGGEAVHQKLKQIESNDLKAPISEPLLTQKQCGHTEEQSQENSRLVKSPGTFLNAEDF